MDIPGPLLTRGETRCPGGVSVSCLASRTRHECPRHNKSSKRTNDKIKSLFVALASYSTQQNESTTKSNLISSFWRILQRNKTNKRLNEDFFVVLTPYATRQNNKRRNANLKFHLSFVRFCEFCKGNIS